MNIAGAITTSNTETQKSLKSIDATLKKILVAQKAETKAASDREKKAAQAAKRAEADGKGKNRLAGIMGTGGDKEEKGGDVKKGGGWLKKLLIGAGIAGLLAAGFKALFGDKNILGGLTNALFGEKGLFGKENRDKMWEGLFGTDGMFGSKNREKLFEMLFNDQTGWFGKESRTKLWNSLFGEDGMFGKAGREQLMNMLFGPEGMFGSKNLGKLNNFLFGKDGIFGEDMRKNTSEFLFGDDGVFGKKTLKGAYEGMKSFFIDDADWKKAARQGMTDFFIKDAPWKVAIREGFDTILKDVTNFTKELLEALGGWVRNLPGFKQVGDAADAIGGGFDWLAGGMREMTSNARQTLGLEEKPVKKQLDEAKQRREQLQSQLDANVGPYADPIRTGELENKIAEQDALIKKLEGETSGVEPDKNSTYTVSGVTYDTATGLPIPKEDVPQKLQRGGPVRVPGSGEGDKVPMSLPRGSFVLNKNASNFLYRQSGGKIEGQTTVPTMLEPQETVFPFTTPALQALNSAIPRFGSGDTDEGIYQSQLIKKAKDETSQPRRGDGPPSEQKLNENTFEADIKKMVASEAKSAMKKGGKIFLHWTAGGYQGKPVGYYHNIVTGDGKRHQMQSYDQFSTPEGHTWRRNHTGVGISMAAMAGGIHDGAWPTPPKSAQIEGMAKEIAKVGKMWGWKESDFTIQNVMTHTEAALRKDGFTGHPNYGPHSGDSQTKWDLESLSSKGPKNGGSVLRQKALNYFKGGGFTDGGGNLEDEGGGKFFFPMKKSHIGTDPYQLFGAPRDGGARSHAGIDLVESSPWGSNPALPVYAVKDGTVMQEKYSHDAYAGGMMISQGDGFDTRYVHMNNFKVKPGQKVKAGQQIGNLISLPLGGDGGNSHLHFELYKNNSSAAIDPTSYLKSSGKSGQGNRSSDGMSDQPDGSDGTDTSLTQPPDPKKGGKGWLEKYLGPFAGILKQSKLFMEGFMGPLVGLAGGAGSLALGKVLGQEETMKLVEGGNDMMGGLMDMINGLIGGDITDGSGVDRAMENVDTSNLSGDPGTGNSGAAIAGNQEAKGVAIAKRLMADFDLHKNSAAGIVGNLMLESGLQPDNVENGKGFDDGPVNNIPKGTQRVGYGYGQWTNDRLEKIRDFLTKRGAADRPATDEDNYAYLKHELSTSEPVRNHWKTNTSIPDSSASEAATWFMMNWERPSVPHQDKRQSYANQIVQKLQTGGQVGNQNVLLEPGETVGTLDMWNQAIPRFQSGGLIERLGVTADKGPMNILNSLLGTGASNSMSTAPNNLLQKFFDNSDQMESGGGNPVNIIHNHINGNNQEQQAVSNPTNPVPALSGGPSMAALSDVINRVSWSSVF